jgi:hypothetical protein
VRNGEWEVRITLDSGQVELAYYNLQAQANGTIMVEGSLTDQNYTGAGWTGSTMNFGDSCGLVDTTTWCIYYEMVPSGLEAMTGVTKMVANGDNANPFTFTATARWLGH